MAQKNPLYYNVAPANVEAFNTTERKELGFVGGEDGKSGYIVTKGRKFGMSTEDVENAVEKGIKDTGAQTASTGKYISGVSLTSGSLAITETELPKTTVDQDKKSFTSDGTTYTLAIDKDGQLSVSAFKALQITSLIIPAADPSGNVTNKVIEYDGSHSYTMSLKPSNEATFTLDLGTETIDTTNSYIELFRLDDEGTDTYRYKTSITSALSQTISIPSTEQAYAPTINTPYTLNKTTTSYTSDPTKEQNVKLYIETSHNQGEPYNIYEKEAKIDSTTIKSTATIKYRFKWSNQEINAGNFKNGTAGTDYQLYAGGTDRPKNLTCPGSTDPNARYCIAFPAAWTKNGDPVLSTQLGDDTSSWIAKPNITVYDGVEYKVWIYNQHQDDNGTWTITWK